jgi:hypothetical protein
MPLQVTLVDAAGQTVDCVSRGSDGQFERAAA